MRHDVNRLGVHGRYGELTPPLSGIDYMYGTICHSTQDEPILPSRDRIYAPQALIDEGYAPAPPMLPAH